MLSMKPMIAEEIYSQYPVFPDIAVSHCHCILSFFLAHLSALRRNWVVALMLYGLLMFRKENITLTIRRSSSLTIYLFVVTIKP